MRHIRSHQCCSTETRAVVKSTPGATSFYGRPLGEAVGPPWVPARSRSWSPLKQMLEERSKKQTLATAAEQRRDRRRLPSPLTLALAVPSAVVCATDHKPNTRWSVRTLRCVRRASLRKNILQSWAPGQFHCELTFYDEHYLWNQYLCNHFESSVLIAANCWWLFAYWTVYCLTVYASLFITAYTLFLSYHSYVYALSFIIACTFLLSCHAICIVYAMSFHFCVP